MPRKIRKMWIAAFIVTAGVLAVLLSVALQVDDWSRDLSTNRAATSVDASDDSLRTLTLAATIEEVRTAIDQFVAERSLWSVGETNSNEAGYVQIALVRTTQLFRFADDIEVTLQTSLEGTLVDAVSQSRVGKGDLGQNPRNLRELLTALRSAF